jgi:purine-binding chemotaxis protein CheW
MTPALAGSAVPEQVLEFTLGEERYCLDIEMVDEIVKPGEVTVLPDVPPDVVGMMDLRGETTTLIDPAVTLGVDTTPDSQRVIVFDTDGEERLGWLVDQVRSVVELDASVVEPGIDSEYVEGLVTGGDQFVLWLDPDQVNDSPGR